MQFGGIGARLAVDQVDQLGVVLNAPHLQEGVVHLAKSILKSAKQSGQGRGGGSRGIPNDTASRCLNRIDTWL